MKTCLSKRWLRRSLIFLTAGWFTGVAFSQEPWTKGSLLFKDDFNDTSLGNWIVEVEKPDQSVVDNQEHQLNIDVAGGVTIWLKHKLEGNMLIEYDVMVVKKGGANDRVSDLNQFWMATDPDNPNLFTRSGKFSQYHALRMYYVGMGGNNNSTTRFRRYPGGGERPMLGEHKDPEYLLTPNTHYHIEIICSKGQTQFRVNGKVYHNFQDPEPLVKGYFGFRTIRQPDKRYLEDQNLKGAALYKADSRRNQSDERVFHSEHEYQLHCEKETRKMDSYADVADFCSELDRTDNVPNFFEQRVHVTRYINFLCAGTLCQNWDGFNKNHFIGFDTDHSGRFFALPWDLDRNKWGGERDWRGGVVEVKNLIKIAENFYCTPSRTNKGNTHHSDR